MATTAAAIANEDLRQVERPEPDEADAPADDDPVGEVHGDHPVAPAVDDPEAEVDGSEARHRVAQREPDEDHPEHRHGQRDGHPPVGEDVEARPLEEDEPAPDDEEDDADARSASEERRSIVGPGHLRAEDRAGEREAQPRDDRVVDVRGRPDEGRERGVEDRARRR